MTQEVIHGLSPDGRDQHYFVKVEGVWTCDCGETKE